MWDRWTARRALNALHSYRVICELLEAAARATDPRVPPPEGFAGTPGMFHLAEVKADIEMAVDRLAPLRRIAALLYWFPPSVVTLRDVARLMGCSYRHAQDLVRLARRDVVDLLCRGRAAADQVAADVVVPSADAVAIAELLATGGSLQRRLADVWITRKLTKHHKN